MMTANTAPVLTVRRPSRLRCVTKFAWIKSLVLYVVEPQLCVYASLAVVPP